MLQRSCTASISSPAHGPTSPFTRVLGGQRQRSRRFRTPVHPAVVLTSAPTYGTHPPSCTRYNPVKPYTQRRQRSKRFRPCGHAASRAELSPTLLLPVESHAPSPQCTAAVSPTPANTRAEPPLLPAESAALSSQGPGLPLSLVAPPAICLGGSHPTQAPHLLLPHASEFPGVFFPPTRPNTDARSNAVSRTVTYDAPRASTRLQRDAWAFFLSDYPDRDFVDTLLHIIDYGANIGFLGDRTSPQTSRNLRSAEEHSEVVAADLQIQISKHRVHGPFPAPPFSNFRSSPLGVAVRKRSAKLRVIHHLSWPRYTSVNSGVPDSEASIVYETFHSAVKALQASGRGSRMIKLDLEQAFRQIPVRPEDWPLLGFNWLGQFFYHVVLAFGLRSAPYIFNLFSEGLHWIMAHHLPAFIRHLLDDFLQIFPPSAPASLVDHALQWSLGLGSALGLCFQPSKIEGPATALDFLGITLDSITMEARLPPDKLAYLSELLQAWESRSHCHLLELQELTGYLQFCSQVIPFSRAFIRSIFSFMASFSTPYTRRRIPKPVHRDLRWWLNMATTWNGISIIDPERQQTIIHTDASGTKGAGGILQDEWFAVRIPRRYRARDIKFKEFYAIIYAILCWGDRFRGRHVLFHTDNTDVHATITNLTIRSEPMMELLRQFLSLACRFDFTFESRWIPGSTNSLADAASRFQYQRLFDLAPYLQRKPSLKVYRIDSSESLPSGLRPRISLF